MDDSFKDAPETRPEAAPGAGGEPSAQATALEARVIDALSQVYDPEIPVNIYELGLIYDIRIEPEEGAVEIEMTLTSPMCPVAESLPGEVEMRVRGVEGVRSVSIDLVWDPPWSPDRISETGRLELGLI